MQNPIHFPPAPTSPRRGRCPHRPARFRVQGGPKAQSLPLVTKGRWHGEAVTEGIRAGSDRRPTIPQSRCASQLPLHKGACPLRRWGWRRSAGCGGKRGPGRAADSRPYGYTSGLLVGADAHIGPPGSVCKAVRRPKASPWRPRGPQGSAASGRYSDRSGQAEGLTEGISAGRDWELTIPQSRCASQLPLHKGACPLRHREADSGRRRCGGCDSRPRTRHARPYGVRRGCGGNWGPARAAIQAAPTDAPPIRFVGRGAHTPPNQAAGIAGLASIAAAAGPLVGAGFMPARAAPPGATGPRS